MSFLSKVNAKFKFVSGDAAPPSEVTSKELKIKLAEAIKKAEMMLDLVDLETDYSVYLIGSRAANKSNLNSDWDFLIVGKDFDALEDERISLFEEGKLPKELALDCASKLRKDSVDVIFSSNPPKNNQPNVKLK